MPPHPPTDKHTRKPSGPVTAGVPVLNIKAHCPKLTQLVGPLWKFHYAPLNLELVTPHRPGEGRCSVYDLCTGTRHGKFLQKGRYSLTYNESKGEASLKMVLATPHLGKGDCNHSAHQSSKESKERAAGSSLWVVRLVWGTSSIPE